MKAQAIDWANALHNGQEPVVCDLSTIIFELSSCKSRLEDLGSDKHDGKIFFQKKQIRLSLLTLYLLTNGIATLNDLEANPLVLVFGIFKVPFNGCYLPLSILGALISAKQYLRLARVYPGLPPIADLESATLERQLSS